jgi:uncharacterized phiE125 gp8 family phage protein
VALIRHTAPSGQVVTTAEAKAQMRVTSSAEDALVALMIEAATEEAEHLMGRALLPQKWQLTLDSWPAVIELQRPPVTALDSVHYLADADGADTELDGAAYQLAKAHAYTARLLPAFGTSWPATRLQAEAVRVVFSCGYADAASVPLPIKRWILARVASYDKHREQWTAGYVIEPNSHIDHLLDGYRTFLM